QLDTGRLKRLSQGRFTGADVEQGLPQLIAFLAAGMMAPSLKSGANPAPASSRGKRVTARRARA
ncbi:MAG TPA: hypothetical protein VLJ86_28000, partial [Ramlibacter sp.]|nr:hypothetical protein [Ramlibacter sp.]